MPVAVQYPHIAKHPGKSACLESMPRIRVAQIVMDHLGRGWSVGDIAEQYPHLRPSEIHSILAYYYDNQQEIDHEIRAEMHQSQSARAVASNTPLAMRLASLANADDSAEMP